MGDTGMASGVPDPNGCPAPKARSRRRGQASRAAVSGDAARQALDCLYQAHYQSLVRLAALLTGDASLAEKIAADSLVALLSCPLAAHTPEGSLFHLRQQVVIRSRRVARSRSTSRRGEPGPPGPGCEKSPAVRVLESLPARQREAIVLLHYLDLGEKDVAAVMGASDRAVRGFLATAWSALQGVVGDGPEQCRP